PWSSSELRAAALSTPTDGRRQRFAFHHRPPAAYEPGRSPRYPARVWRSDRLSLCLDAPDVVQAVRGNPEQPAGHLPGPLAPGELRRGLAGGQLSALPSQQPHSVDDDRVRDAADLRAGGVRVRAFTVPRA